MADTTAQGPPGARTCVEPGCGTRLSRYNDAEHCARHMPMVSIRTRGRPTE